LIAEREEKQKMEHKLKDWEVKIKKMHELQGENKRKGIIITDK
jgi:predicted  nucleic acid-binding Zn-ribbon protein